MSCCVFVCVSGRARGRRGSRRYKVERRGKRRGGGVLIAQGFIDPNLADGSAVGNAFGRMGKKKRVSTARGCVGDAALLRNLFVCGVCVWRRRRDGATLVEHTRNGSVMRLERSVRTRRALASFSFVFFSFFF